MRESTAVSQAYAREGSSRPAAIDIFAGGGGLSLGLEQAGFDIILAIDRDPYHAATLQRNFPLARVLCADVRRLEGRKIRELIGDIEIDLICGGPPCQGFSDIGKRNPSDPRNLLIRHFARLVVELKPKGFLMENVPGLQSTKRNSPLKEAIDTLMGAGYRITEPVRPLDASDFGVPQKRERLFVIGVRAEFNAVARYPRASCKHRPARPTVWEAIGDLPRVSARQELFQTDISEYQTSSASQLNGYAAIARGIRIDPCDLAHFRIWDQTKCTGCSRVRHRPDVVRLYAATAPGAFVPSHHLPRLDPNGLSPTLRAGTDSEHGSFNAPRPIHPYEPRCITVREAARLHGYPDWFLFHPTKWHAHQQIGNSVCPPVARALGFSIRRALKLPAQRRSLALPLGEAFEIPKRRGKRVRRIAQLDEWPKILKYLLQKAGGSAREKLKKPTFSIGDVAEAYRQTGARMPRTPPGHFLADIARSRNRDQLLAPITRQGLSIAQIGRNGVYGQFVLFGTPGGLEGSRSLGIGGPEIRSAIRITRVTGTPTSLSSTLRFLGRPYVRRLLVNGRKLADLDPKPRRINNRTIIRCALRSKFRREVALILPCDHRNLPELSSVDALLTKGKARKCLIVTAATRRHLAIIVIERTAGTACVKRRFVFETSQPRSRGREKIV